MSVEWKLYQASLAYKQLAESVFNHFSLELKSLEEFNLDYQFDFIKHNKYVLSIFKNNLDHINGTSYALTKTPDIDLTKGPYIPPKHNHHVPCSNCGTRLQNED